MVYARLFEKRCCRAVDNEKACGNPNVLPSWQSFSLSFGDGHLISFPAMSMQARTKSLYACKTVPFGTPVIKEMCKIMAPFTENLSRIRATANCNDTGAYLLDELL